MRLGTLMALVLVLPSCWGWGCAARRPLPPPELPLTFRQVRPPEDLTIAVTVAGLDSPDPVFAPSRFIIEPGGLLRAAVGPGVSERVFPPRTRRLSDAQINEVYTLIVREGLALPRSFAPAPVLSTRRDDVAHGVVVSLTVDDQRTAALHTPEASPHARELVARLRQLARLDN
jgi:hypothetical protein